MSGTPTVQTVTILNGQSLSNAIGLNPNTLVGIVVPATWTAANLSLQASFDGGQTFGEFADKAAPYAIVAAAGNFIGLDPAVFRGVTTIKIRSGTSGAPVTQGGDRVLQVITLPVT